MTRVTIVGAGNMGCGIGTRAVAGGHDVEIVDPHLPAHRGARDPSSAASSARLETPSLV